MIDSDRVWIVQLVCNLNLVNAEQERHKARLAAHEQRLDRLAAVNGYQWASIGAIKLAAAKLTTRVATLETKVTGIAARVGALEAARARIDAGMPRGGYSSRTQGIDINLPATPTSVQALTDAGGTGAFTTAASSRIMATATVQLATTSATPMSITCVLQYLPTGLSDWSAMSQPSIVTIVNSAAPTTGEVYGQIALVGAVSRTAGTVDVRVACLGDNPNIAGTYRSGNLDVWSTPL